MSNTSGKLKQREINPRGVMALKYFKRFRMEIRLAGRDFYVGRLPLGYRVHPWHEDLIDGHAAAKYQSFRDEIDANVFPCLGDSEGCHRLMNEIAVRDGFMSAATWLVSWQDGIDGAIDYCGTIQGIQDRSGVGAVQNLGVVAEHRGQGLGEILLARALIGFQQAGLRRAFLEVTAQNKGAIRLYKRFGFSRVRTVYKAVQRESPAVRV